MQRKDSRARFVIREYTALILYIIMVLFDVGYTVYSYVIFLTKGIPASYSIDKYFLIFQLSMLIILGLTLLILLKFYYYYEYKKQRMAIILFIFFEILP